jgi:hypothetical protein
MTSVWDDDADEFAAQAERSTKPLEGSKPSSSSKS